MNNRTERFFLTRPFGQLECAVDRPIQTSASGRYTGLALIAHPHPLYGGTMDNKVAQTLARAFVDLGSLVVRMNFRGVGKSEGSHDNGHGETDDFYALWHHCTGAFAHELNDGIPAPLYLAGFSFGAFVQAQFVQRLSAQAIRPTRIVLVGAPAKKWEMPLVPVHTELIHGELDETIPLSDLFDWLRPQQLAVTVLPGADHFFHQRLGQLRQIVVNTPAQAANI